MFVGTAKLTLSIPGAASLKDKRQVLRKLIDRTRARFNAAVAEVGDNDLWQRAVVGVSVVGNERRFTEEQLDTVIRFIEESYLAPVLDRHTEVNAVGGFNNQSLSPGDLRIPTGDERTLAEAEEDGAEHFDGENDFFKA